MSKVVRSKSVITKKSTHKEIRISIRVADTRTPAARFRKVTPTEVALIVKVIEAQLLDAARTHDVRSFVLGPVAPAHD